jgi:hypothetical protein
MSCATCRGTRTNGVDEVVDEEPARGGVVDNEPASAPAVGVLNRQTYQGDTRGSRLCGEDRDRETENSKVCARTRDTRFIHVRVATVATLRPVWSSISCPALGVVPGGIVDVRLGTRPSII